MADFTVHHGERQPDSGKRVLADVFDMLRTRLPLLPADDPVRRELLAALPALGASLGRPAVVAVPDLPLG